MFPAEILEGFTEPLAVAVALPFALPWALPEPDETTLVAADPRPAFGFWLCWGGAATAPGDGAFWAEASLTVELVLLDRFFSAEVTLMVDLVLERAG